MGSACTGVAEQPILLLQLSGMGLVSNGIAVGGISVLSSSCDGSVLVLEDRVAHDCDALVGVRSLRGFLFSHLFGMAFEQL